MGDIQGGGDKDEQPVHEIALNPFALGRYEVTNAQYVAFLNGVKRRGKKEEPWFETAKEDRRSRISATEGKFTVEKGYES